MAERIEQIYPENPFNEITKERYSKYTNKITLLNKGLCSAPRSRRTPAPTPPPPPDAPLIKVIGTFGNFDDEDGIPRQGLKFICKASQKNVLFIDDNIPVFGRLFYGKFERIKFTLGNNEDWHQTPEKIIFYAGDQEFNTTDNSSFITGQVNHPTEFWLYIDETPLVLKDNKGEFEFVLFFYTEQSFQYLKNKISEFNE